MCKKVYLYRECVHCHIKRVVRIDDFGPCPDALERNPEDPQVGDCPIGLETPYRFDGFFVCGCNSDKTKDAGGSMRGSSRYKAIEREKEAKK